MAGGRIKVEGGGDCPGLNAVIRAVAKAAAKRGWKAIGFLGGYEGILDPPKYRTLNYQEIPFTYESVCAKIHEREQAGKRFTVVIAAEGAREKAGGFVTAAGQQENREARLGGVGAVVAAEIEKRTGKECRACVLGHLQRGGSPTNFDRALCSMYGAEAVELIATGQFGQMVSFQASGIGAVAISEAISKLKTVPPDGSLARTARALGICPGD
jgi:ATP-dependent phosphofructokinase / diphosphate-dependent phosphofructokinase